MKLTFTHDGFVIQGNFKPATLGTSEEPGDEAEFIITYIIPEDPDEILEIAKEEYGEQV